MAGFMGVSASTGSSSGAQAKQQPTEPKQDFGSAVKTEQAKPPQKATPAKIQPDSQQAAAANDSNPAATNQSPLMQPAAVADAAPLPVIAAAVPSSGSPAVGSAGAGTAQAPTGAQTQSLGQIVAQSAPSSLTGQATPGGASGPTMQAAALSTSTGGVGGVPITNPADLGYGTITQTDAGSALWGLTAEASFDAAAQTYGPPSQADAFMVGIYSGAPDGSLTTDPITAAITFGAAGAPLATTIAGWAARSLVPSNVAQMVAAAGSASYSAVSDLAAGRTPSIPAMTWSAATGTYLAKLGPSYNVLNETGAVIGQYTEALVARRGMTWAASIEAAQLALKGSASELVSLSAGLGGAAITFAGKAVNAAINQAEGTIGRFVAGYLAAMDYVLPGALLTGAAKKLSSLDGTIELPAETPAEQPPPPPPPGPDNGTGNGSGYTARPGYNGPTQAPLPPNGWTPETLNQDDLHHPMELSYSDEADVSSLSVPIGNGLQAMWFPHGSWITDRGDWLGLHGGEGVGRWFVMPSNSL
jgi:hypothetical protein